MVLNYITDFNKACSVVFCWEFANYTSAANMQETGNICSPFFLT